jgi:hypothetical protein
MAGGVDGGLHAAFQVVADEVPLDGDANEVDDSLGSSQVLERAVRR